MSFIEARRHGDVKELTLLLLYSYEIQPCNSEDVFFFSEQTNSYVGI